MEYQSTQSRALAPGSMLKKRYRIGQLIGSGQCGLTYEAFDTVTRRSVAIKEFFPARLCLRAADTGAVSPLDRESGTQFFIGSEAFLSQHSALMQAAGCRSLVSVYDAFFENGTSYAVMEKLEGVPLSVYAARIDRRLSPGETVTLLNELTNALLVVHSLSMLHGDITPDHVFVCRDGSVKLIDFSAARESLKLRRKAGDSPDVDIRALGRMLCTLLTGRPAPADPASLSALTPSPLFGVLARMLTSDDAQRFTSVFELMHALNCLDIAAQVLVIPVPRAEAPVPVRREEAPDRPRPVYSAKTRKRARLILLVGGVLLTLFVILIVVIVKRA